MISAAKYLGTAHALLAESQRHDGSVRRGLEKLSAKLMRDAVVSLSVNDNGQQGTSWRTSPLPVAAGLEEGRA